MALLAARQSYSEDAILGMVIHSDGQPLHVNMTFAGMLGYDDPEQIARLSSIDEIVFPADRAKIAAIRANTQNCKPTPKKYTFRAVRRDKSIVWLESHDRLLSWHGVPAVRSLLYDVTDLKQDRAVLGVCETTYRTVAENTVWGVLVLRGERALFANQAFADMLGYDNPYEIQDLNRLHANLIACERLRLDPDNMCRQEGPEPARHYEMCLPRKDTALLWLEVRVDTVNWDGAPATLVTCSDITRRKDAEKALRDSEQRFKDFSEAAADWFWETDACGHCTYISKKHPAHGPKEWIAGIKKLSAGTIPAAHRDDRDWVALRDQIKQGAPIKEFVFATTDTAGATAYHRINGKPVFDDEQKFKGYRGTGIDITAETHARNLIAEGRREFHDAIEHAVDCYAWYDAHDRLAARNACYREGGVPIRGRDESIGKTFEDMLREAVARGELADAVGNEEAWISWRLKQHRHPRNPFALRFSDGSWGRVREHRMPSGGCIIIYTDITEQMRMQVELKNLALQLSRAEQNERRSFATYLHDEISQTLALLKLKLDVFKSSKDPAALERCVGAMEFLIDQTNESVRSLTFELYPPSLNVLGLPAVFEAAGAKICEENGLRFKFRNDGVDESFDPDINALLFRAARELVINAVKHAHASTITTTMSADAGEVRVMVEDDGEGFETEVSDAPRTDSFGLNSIRERMTGIGGRLHIESSVGHGTRATLIAPTTLTAT